MMYSNEVIFVEELVGAPSLLKGHFPYPLNLCASALEA